MARIPTDSVPAASLLDRLLSGDDDPSAPQGVDGRSSLAAGGSSDWRRVLREVQSAVFRDLEWLLNARSPYTGRVRDAGVSSVLDFGLPDSTLLDLRDDVDRGRFTKRMAVAIERHEPRLRDVVVEARGFERGPGQTCFHVFGTMMVDQRPVEFAFDTTVRWSNRAVEIDGEAQ